MESLVSDQKFAMLIEVLKDEFEEIEDPREERTRLHELDDIIIIALLASVCGCDDFVEIHDFANYKHEWLATFLNLPYGIPSVATFRRVFAALDPDSFNACFENWTHRLRDLSAGELIALDGKMLRGSKDRFSGRRAVNIVNAWASSNRLIIGQEFVDSKSNEITAIPRLLARLNVAGCVITADALNCQKEIARDICNAEADYILSVKGNHPTLHAELEDLFEKGPDNSTMADQISDTDRSLDKGHDRFEIRDIKVQKVEPQDGQDLQTWVNIKTAICIKSQRMSLKNGTKTEEKRYYVSSLEAITAEQVGNLIRRHWGVENSVHWVLDVVFDEDGHRSRDGFCAQNMSTLRKMTLNMLRQEPSKISLKRKRKIAFMSHGACDGLCVDGDGGVCGPHVGTGGTAGERAVCAEYVG